MDKNEISFEDPFNGFEHLKDGSLHTLSENFAKDPVRFLRLVRFQLKFQMILPVKTKQLLHNFNLTKCSDFHFLNEFQKSKHSDFFQYIF